MNNINFELKNKNLKYFINNIIKFNNINDIINNFNDPREKGFIFERLWDVIIKLGFCDKFDNYNYNHLIGNINNCKLKELESINYYFENELIISGNKTGKSDITLYNKNYNKYIFITSKFYISLNNKSIFDYDIQDLISIVYKNKHYYKNFDIYFVVNNKDLLINQLYNSNETSNYITEEIKKENILDINNLNIYFNNFKQELIKNDYNSNFNFDNYLNLKPKLIMRFHQELIVEKTIQLINNYKKSFLWGCKCRSGKTFMVGGIISKLNKIFKFLNILIITPAPTETIPQFTDDLFKKYNDFNNFKIIELNNKNINNLNLTKNNIIISSKQFLQKYVNENVIKNIKNLNLDLIIFDENHFSGTTDKSKDILNSYSKNNTNKIYLTATYNKPLKEWNILQECQMYWDLEDEQICKSIIDDNNNLNKLIEKHGSIVNNIINYYYNNKYSLNDIFNPYLNMPNLEVITNLYDKNRYEAIKKYINKSVYGFCFETLYSLNDNKDCFNYRNSIKTFLRYISGSNKDNDFEFGDKSIFGRIESICKIKNTRNPFVQLWFLPPDNINNISNLLIQLAKEDKILNNYSFLPVNRKNEDIPKKDIKILINNEILKSKAEEKKGLIILAGSMLSLGITIELCDVVILMNDSISFDKVLQQMFRCMTEGENKKIGIVVDLNISRVLNTFINYNIYQKDLSPENKINYLIKHHIINIDTDLFDNKINTDKITKDLVEIWKSDPINNMKTLLNNLLNEYENFDNETQKKLNNIFTKSFNENINSITITIESDDDIQDMQDGIQKIKIEDDNNNVNNNKKEEKKDKKEITISFTKDVLPYIIPLSCILTLDNNKSDFVDLLNHIKENKELIEVFDDQCKTWWKKTDLLDFIKNLTLKYFDKTSNIYNISLNIKLNMIELLDMPDKSLEFINSCLKPKEIEKKENGEVFTPLKLVNEMLDKLPEEVWYKKDFKWYDNSSGMGNFPVCIYLRLMKTLEEIIQDKEERKKHILENMLYMSELNKKNVFITKQILNINNKYKLNIYQGDSLKLNTEKVFGVKEFDIIVGNPPYQKCNNNGERKALNHNLWCDFVIKSFNNLKNKTGFLLYITPTSWMSPTSKLKDIFFKNNLLFLNINECKKYFNSVGSNFSYFLINKNSNSENNILSDVICEFDNKIYESKCNLNNIKFLPNLLSNNSINILNKFYNNNIEKISFKTSCELHNTTHKDKLRNKKDDIFKYPIQHTKNIRFSKIKHSLQDKKKILIGLSGYVKPYYDDGVLGFTQNQMYYLTNDNNFINIIKSNIYNFIFTICKWSGFNNEKIFHNIPYIKLNNINNLTDENIYNYFNLNEEEIKLIEEVLNIKKDKKEINNNLNNNQEQDLTKLKKDELIKICKEKNIKNYSNKKKEDLIKLINNN